MISLDDFQPLFISKMNVFYQQLRVYRRIFEYIIVSKYIRDYDLLMRCVALKYIVLSWKHNRWKCKQTVTIVCLFIVCINKLREIDSAWNGMYKEV